MKKASTSGQDSEKKNSRSRGWIFTDFTLNADKFLDPPDWVRYTAYALEVCPSTGKEHFQGFLEAYEPVSMIKIKTWMPVQRLAQRNGTLAQNKTYCSKEGTLVECGERPAQGRRVDLISIKRRIDEGEKLDDIEDDENCFGVVMQHRKCFEQYERKKRRKIMKDSGGWTRWWPCHTRACAWE